MNYSDVIQRSINFIEQNIKKDLTPEQLASLSGYSLFHFCRVFSHSQNIPVMDYIRKRRLAVARIELLQNRKVIDVALDFGFETASGFSRSFRKEFGYSPTTYIARMKGIQFKQIITEIGDFIMNPIITTKPAFKVAGYGINTDITNGYMKDIAAYWDTYTGENLECKMYSLLNPPKHGEVGLCVTSSSNSNITYLLGVIVDDFSNVTPDMITVDVPDADYAVFTTPPVDLTKQSSLLADVIKSMWKYIFEEWFPTSEYVYDETKMDFEFYDERCHARPDSTMDIYIPVIKKSTSK